MYMSMTKKSFKLPWPTQLATQRQWWSIFRTQRPHLRQWWVRGGFTHRHCLHTFMYLLRRYSTWVSDMLKPCASVSREMPSKTFSSWGSEYLAFYVGLRSCLCIRRGLVMALVYSPLDNSCSGIWDSTGSSTDEIIRSGFISARVLLVVLRETRGPLASLSESNRLSSMWS